MSYIIDFDRVNQLSSHDNDNPTTGMQGTFVHNISRKIIREYLDIYTDSVTHQGKISYKYTQETLNEVIETLRYNKILIDKSDIRDQKIEQVLN